MSSVVSNKRVFPQPAPRDVRVAIGLMRALGEPLSMKRLARECGVAERTLNAHFRAFVGLSPIRYLLDLRLAAARQALHAGGAGVSVTKVTQRYGFNHPGRFAAQYRQRFGESPSTTLHGRRLPPAEPGRAALPGDEGKPPPAIGTRERPSIAILFDQPSSYEPSLRGLTDAIAERIAAALGSLPVLAVNFPSARRAAAIDPRRTARELGARYVLSGRVVQAGARLRVTLRIFEAATGHHVWGDCFEGHQERIFELHDRIVAGVLRNTLSKIRGAEIERAARAVPRSLDAYGLTMRALPLLFASRPDASQQALQFLHRAIEFDPDYPLAIALAAWGHAQLVMYNGTTVPRAERERAARLVRRAAIYDDDDPLALTARCAVHTMATEFDIAETLVARALARDPTCGWAWERSAWLHAYRGDSKPAISHFRRALLTAPRAARANDMVGIGAAHFNAGRYEAAASWLRKAMLEQPGTVWANRSLSVSYAHMGERAKALESLDALRRFSPDLTVSQVVAAVPFRPAFLDRLGDGLSELGLPP